MVRIADAVLSVLVLAGKLVGWLVLPLIAFVCLTVLAASAGWNSFMMWGYPVFLLGEGITVNTLADLQWYIFAIISVFGGVYAYRDDQHVAVDVFSNHLPKRAQIALLIFGDLVFLLPFCLIIAWYGWSFMVTAFESGEGSTYGGLMDRWVIKALIPVGFGMLGLAAIARAIHRIHQLTGAGDDASSRGTIVT
jgi:TRAP-type mannitol/chloroaromatic compound transport system permease small subunit